MLDGVNVALGVSGSIAAVKVVELAHELRRQGANVRGVMTESAQGIIHPWALEFATGNDVVTELTGRVEHVELCGRDGWADVLLLAPATANTVGKIASAIDDTPVTTCATTALGADLPVVIAPAMHEPMYDHPGVLDAIDRVESWGVDFVDPRIEEGKAKIATEDAIVTATARATTEQTLAGRHVVVTSGATAEAIDPVRILTNRASGKTGRAVARACYVRGADVTLVHDAGDVHYADTVTVESAAEMRDAVLAAVGGTDADGDASAADVVVSAAAISDYTVEAAAEKLRSGDHRTLELEPTPKLLDGVREAYPDLPIVGFKAETSGDDEKMVAAARDILERTDLAFVVANDASVMGDDETRTLFVDADAVDEFSGSKTALGGAIADRIAATVEA
ncbi:bifunctional phosphopantothenoylcysteine decarboxylase/phosphopantothenate--cysteine ligase CoaBC [Halobellus sp. Atlit-38R]|uniref:bifunctional phosphopantothenoylcysteine decarboxylase/phosphopantothenate--cysteine ligase CoaBC n=1 Tax=Halobellus sp. Atlit-38R TaxID=2282131 RepID=UPI000EF25580|nr:bifunctional phosphopantothenoylcysteine decarboxylase/phosphopantothenate--cysteine ligase CoaBC [Halobellus sp. Atlit-38R]RLM90071.1 bifunctional phosphopantothenoylcysteine decarboxylase/phosphopantothenate--cysteine ligase CoaBC [Halobellus sp. Atlit-38R]